MNKKTIILAVIVIALAVSGWFLFKGPTQQVSRLDAVDTVGNFYDQWLKAAQEPTTTDPTRADLAKSPILSKELRDKLTDALRSQDAIVDPVLCQATTPEQISIRSVYVYEDRAQILVTSRDNKVTDQAIVTLLRLDDGWYIDSIECSLGEFAPEREFSFEREGYLLKSSIPTPFDPKNWHLIFEENGELGHVVPLFFDTDSQCTALDGSVSVCKPEQFKEATKTFVHGQLSERGVSVKKLEFVK